MESKRVAESHVWYLWKTLLDMAPQHLSPSFPPYSQTMFPASKLKLGHWGGSVGWVSAFGSSCDSRVLGWSPTSSSLLIKESAFPCSQKEGPISGELRANAKGHGCARSQSPLPSLHLLHPLAPDSRAQLPLAASLICWAAPAPLRVLRTSFFLKKNILFIYS